MNLIEQALKAGFAAQKQCGGREVTASTGEKRFACIEDVPMIAEPIEQIRAKLPLYTRVYIMAGEIENPRAVETFTEVKSGRFHKVIKYEEASQANWRMCWLCEAQRG